MFPLRVIERGHASRSPAHSYPVGMVAPARMRQQGSGACLPGRFGAGLGCRQDLLPLLAQLPQPLAAPSLLAIGQIAMEDAVQDPCALFGSQVGGSGALSIGPTHADELLLELALVRDRILFGQVLGTVSPILGLIDESELADAIL